MFCQLQVLTVVVVALGSHVRPAGGANILAFFPLPVYSHFSGFNPLFLELAERGHHVTVVSAFQPKGTVPSTYKHVTITNVKITRSTNPLDIRNTYRLTNLINVKKNMMNTVRRSLVLKDTQEFLNDTQYAFDLVLSECWYSDAYLAVGHRYSAPVVCLSPMMPSATLSSALGSPNNPSFVPSFWLHYSDVMSFGERMYNALITSAEMLLSGVVLRDAEQLIADTVYTYPGHDRCPSLDELRRAVVLTLVNSHFSVSYSRPYPPSFVSVAGMHMRPKQQQQKSTVKIEPKLKALLDGATDGVIFFSFGSNIKVSDLPKRYVSMFVESFRKLPQKVLWKWENGSIDNVPDNVYVASWFPQQYILNHENCKIFITHGGYHSLVEALQVGLPLIGFPFYTDQYYNMRFVVENGFGIEINLNELRVDVLDDAIASILFDTSYKEHARRASEVFLDLPASALDTAVYWVEYVIRNGPDFKSTLQSHGLSWYQYFLLDVIASVTAVLVSIAFVFYALVKLVCRRCSYKKLKVAKSS